MRAAAQNREERKGQENEAGTLVLNEVVVLSAGVEQTGTRRFQHLGRGHQRRQ